MARISPNEFINQVKTETRKVAWPTTRETWQTTFFVVVLTTVLALFFFVVDAAFSRVVQLLLRLIG